MRTGLSSPPRHTSRSRRPPRRRAGSCATRCDLAGTAAPATGRTGLVDDAVLLTSELVTNAVVHAGHPGPGHLQAGRRARSRSWSATATRPGWCPAPPQTEHVRRRAHQRARAAAPGRTRLGLGRHLRAGRQGGLVPDGSSRLPGRGIGGRGRPGGAGGRGAGRAWNVTGGAPEGASPASAPASRGPTAPRLASTVLAKPWVGQFGAGQHRAALQRDGSVRV